MQTDLHLKYHVIKSKRVFYLKLKISKTDEVLYFRYALHTHRSCDDFCLGLVYSHFLAAPFNIKPLDARDAAARWYYITSIFGLRSLATRGLVENYKNHVILIGQSDCFRNYQTNIK